jgi:hypothetical protein
LSQHHVGSHRADHGPKHAPGLISNEGGSDCKEAQQEKMFKTAPLRPTSHAQNSLTGATPLPKS